MEERGVKASMALGGIPAAIVEMHEKGLVRTVACSQSFDAVAAKAIVDYPGIIEIDNSLCQSGKKGMHAQPGDIRHSGGPGGGH